MAVHETKAAIYPKTSKFKELSKWVSVKNKRNTLITALIFLLPSLVIFGVFVYYALAFNFYLSFTSWNFIQPVKEFIGFRNYTRLFDAPVFWRSLINTAYFAAGSIGISTITGLIMAVLINQKIPARGFVRTVLFSPYVTTTAAIALLWTWIYHPNYGLFNLVLGWFGIAGPRWLLDQQWAMPALIIMEVWQRTGYVMVIFLAGLQNIPGELYEAAEIDGASPLRRFFNITIPLLSPVTFFIIVTGLLGAFNTFDQVQIMTSGGPGRATTVLNYFIYDQAFVSFRAGYAAAAATVMFIILLIITVLQIFGSKKWVHYLT